MDREIQFRNVSTVLEELDYPLDRAGAADACTGVTLLFADGEADLAGLISETETETFSSVGDVEAALHNVLPREAVGEPYQSDGDA
jgi:hypothetical protein